MRIIRIITLLSMMLLLVLLACTSPILSPTPTEQAPTIAPGKSHFDNARLLCASSADDLKAGETKLIDVTLETRKDGPGEFSCVIFRTDKEYSENTLPMLSGLEVSIEPLEVVAYPNNTYHVTITIKTSPELAVGEYWLRLENKFENVFESTGWIRVDVQ